MPSYAIFQPNQHHRPSPPSSIRSSGAPELATHSLKPGGEEGDGNPAEERAGTRRIPEVVESWIAFGRKSKANEAKELKRQATSPTRTFLRRTPQFFKRKSDVKPGSPAGRHEQWTPRLSPPKTDDALGYFARVNVRSSMPASEEGKAPKWRRTIQNEGEPFAYLFVATAKL